MRRGNRHGLLLAAPVLVAMATSGCEITAEGCFSNQLELTVLDERGFVFDTFRAVLTLDDGQRVTIDCDRQATDRSDRCSTGFNSAFQDSDGSVRVELPSQSRRVRIEVTLDDRLLGTGEGELDWYVQVDGDGRERNHCKRAELEVIF